MDGGIVETTVRALRLARGLERASGANEQRYASVARGALTALGARGIGLILGLVTIPLTVRYLGAERYGAMMTIHSFLAWIAIADLGLGSELTNVLAAAHGRDDERAAREAIASGFWMLCAVAVVLLAVGGLAWSVVDWPRLLNVQSKLAVAEVGPAMGLAFALFCLALPLSVVDRVFISFQRGATANAWAVAANVATVLAVVLATRTQGGLVVLVAATAGTSLAVKGVNAAWLFFLHRPGLRPRWSMVRRKAGARLLARGGVFFLVQIAALVLFSSDNIIIARVLGAQWVTPYSVTWTLFGLSQVLTNATFPYLWAAHGEALARGDGEWVARTLRRSIVVGAGVAGVILVPLTVFGESIIRAWAGPDAVPSHALVYWMAAWYLINAPMQGIAAFLNATGKVEVQMWAGLSCASVNIMLSVQWGRTHGPAGVIAATVVSYLALVIAPVTVVAFRKAKALQNAGRPA
jgi:O-antigen/teichoic acid export membrane protein